jgi:pimeloyl-ACP methyl ester carboxylesterase
VPTFTADDGTTLAYRVIGHGEPLLVLPGGPMRAGEYLGDLGGLSAHRALHVLDLRGSGASGVPADPESLRCDRQVADVESFRIHLGLDTAGILAHSAGATLALLHAVRHPGRIRSLALVAPSLRAVRASFDPADLAEALAVRPEQPWTAAAGSAIAALTAGTATDADWASLIPLSYGRWDDVAQADAAACAHQQPPGAGAAYYAPGGLDPAATWAALGQVTAPVLVLAGELDWQPRPRSARELAAQFPRGVFAEVPGGGHSPWLDDPAQFTKLVAPFLATTSDVR